MKKCINTIRTEVYYGLRNRKFWLALAAFLLLMLLQEWEGLFQSLYLGLKSKISELDTDAIQMSLQVMEGGTFLGYLKYVLYLVPYACCFCDEYNSKTAKYRVERMSWRSYALSKFLTCVILTSLFMLLSQTILLLLNLSVGIPFVNTNEESNTYVNSHHAYLLIDQGHYVWFLLLVFIHTCYSGIFFSTMAMMLSVFIKNRYVLMALPLTIYFSLDNFVDIWFDNGRTLPSWLDWRTRFEHITYGGKMQTELYGFGVTGLFTLGMAVVFYLIFRWRIKEVVGNE